MADHHHLQTGLKMPFRLDMDFADQGAGGIHKHHFATGGLGWHRFGHTVGRKDHRATFWHIIEVFDKNRAQGAQPIDHIFVMHNLVAHIDRCPPFRDRHFHDLDRPVHTCAKPARGGKVQGQGRLGGHTILMRFAKK